jgi:hypothetical protein
MWRVAAALSCVTLVGCVTDPGFHCTTSDQCASGQCESTGYCSFVAGDCASGRRYGAHGGPFSNACVVVDGDGGSVDLASGDLAGVDLAGIDLRQPPDLTVVDLAPPADLAPVQLLIQAGPASTGTGTLTASLPAPTTAGSLLVFTFTFDHSGDPTLPANWGRVSGFSGANSGELWFLAPGSNPGGISNQTVSLTGATASVGQLSEWKTVKTLDAYSWYWDNGPTTKAGNSNTGSSTTAHPSELGLSVFSELTASNATLTLSPAAGWVVLGDTHQSSTKLHYVFSYQLGVPSGLLLIDSVTSPTTGSWGGAVGSFF